MSARRGRGLARLSVVLLALAVAGTACAGSGEGRRFAPTCEPGTRLAIVAQSVPGAAYVPCVATLPTGWSFRDLDVDDEGTTMRLASDRADREVEVDFGPSCDVRRSVPVAPRDEGVRTYQRVDTVDPRFAGAVIDVFPGGCVVTRFDFERGPHVALMTELLAAVDLYPRRQLRQELEDQLGVKLDG